MFDLRSVRHIVMASEDSFPSILNLLNIGGFVYTTTLNTITRDPNSMLGIMFSGRQKVAKDSTGNYFIDRDGALFRYVLNFLRSWELCLPQTFDEFEQLSVEADFYQVGDLIKALQVLREDRSKNKPSSAREHHVDTIVVCERQNERLISGRVELVQEIFKEYMRSLTTKFPNDFPSGFSRSFSSGFGFQSDFPSNSSQRNYIRGKYMENCPVRISSMAIAFDLLYSFGFQLESCINRSVDHCQYIFMRKK